MGQLTDPDCEIPGECVPSWAPSWCWRYTNRDLHVYLTLPYPQSSNLRDHKAAHVRSIPEIGS